MGELSESVDKLCDIAAKSTLKVDYVDAVIRVKVPKWEVGKQALVVFPDSMTTRGECDYEH